MDNISIENLIKVVKQHRALYDTNTKDYFDRTKKKQMWEDVYSLLHPAWDVIDDNEKRLYGKEVQKKWQSLRDCFRRELVLQKNSAALNGKKKAKYKYFDELEFLLPFTQSMGFEITEQDAGFIPESDAKHPFENVTFKRKRELTMSDEEGSNLKSTKDIPSQDNKRSYIDDDEAFLMSLLPGFKEYNVEQKYLLRIELMKTMLKFKESQSGQKVEVSLKTEVYEDHCEYV